MPRAPRFVFERHGSIGRRMWPAAINRDTLDPWYDRVAEALPVTQQTWDDVTYAGGLFAAACDHAGRTANPAPSAIDVDVCTNCNWMMAGCRFDAKRSLLLNYLPAALAHGARDPAAARGAAASPAPTTAATGCTTASSTTRTTGSCTTSGAIDAKIVIVAAGAGATPVDPAALRGRRSARCRTRVGRYFSGNGERLNTAVFDEDRVREVLGLSRGDGQAYEAYQIGRGPTVASWDQLDGALPEYERFSLEQLYFPPGLGTILAQVPDADRPDLVRRGEEGDAASAGSRG